VIRLVCVDVDGTLVGSSGQVDPETWLAADRARATGVLLALCTGRPGFGITRTYAERLSPEGWHIFQNGASVLHLPSGDSRSTPLDERALAFVIERSREAGRVLELYSDLDYAVETDTPVTRAHAALLGVPFRTRSFASLSAPIVRAQWLVSDSEVAGVSAEPRAGLELARSTSPVMPGIQFLNLTPAGVDKSAAVRAVAAAHDVPLSDVMFVGDGSNDALAMRIVGTPVAMGNADAEALAVATHVVGDVDRGGLIEALSLAMSLGAAR
jgi:Cof subfamily protein (haloacid dehalogenase superfamily)